MTPQELKNSILQLAIQGKLVEQRPEEGTAEELYQQIQAEKQKLIKEGKIKKEKPLPEITEEEKPFDIPDGWKWVRLNSITTIEAGGTPDRNIPEYWDGNIAWVKIGDITSKYVSGTTERISIEGLNNSSAKVFRKGTVLYTIFATIGTVGILDIDAATNQAIAGITVYGDLDINYIYYVALGIKTIIYKQAHGMAQMNINQSILKSAPIPLPPVGEQKRIVTKIEELLPLIDRYEKAWSQLEEFNKQFPGDMQKSILQMAIQGKLVEQRPEEGTGEELYQQIQQEKQKLIREGKIKKEKLLPEIAEEEKPFDIPDNWTWCHLQDICGLIGDIDHNMPKAVSENEGVMFLSAKDLLDDGTINYTDNIKYISEEDFSRLSRKALPQRNDIIYSRIGAALGKARVVTTDIRFLVSYSCCTIRPLCVDPFYLRYYLESPFILSHSYEARQSTGVPDLGMGEIKKYIIALPPLIEQKRIVAKIEELIPSCKKLIITQE